MSNEDPLKSVRRKVYIACGVLLVLVVLAHLRLEGQW